MIVFDTLAPEDHPGNSRRLGLPRRFHHRAAEIHIDHDRPLGTPSGNEPFTADPAQAVLVVELIARSWDARVFLVVRMQALIEQARSTVIDPRVPWEEWERDSVVMTIPICHIEVYAYHTFVHGAQVMMVRTYPAWDRSGKYYHGIWVLDFSWRGRSSSSTPLRGGVVNEARWLVMLDDAECIRFELGGGMGSWEAVKSLSDGSLFYLVSCLSQPVGSKS